MSPAAWFGYGLRWRAGNRAFVVRTGPTGLRVQLRNRLLSRHVPWTTRHGRSTHPPFHRIPGTHPGVPDARSGVWCRRPTSRSRPGSGPSLAINEATWDLTAQAHVELAGDLRIRPAPRDEHEHLPHASVSGSMGLNRRRGARSAKVAKPARRYQRSAHPRPRRVMACTRRSGPASLSRKPRAPACRPRGRTRRGRTSDDDDGDGVRDVRPGHPSGHLDAVEPPASGMSTSRTSGRSRRVRSRVILCRHRLSDHPAPGTRRGS